METMSTADDLQSFYQFAEQRVRSVGSDQTLDQLYAEWRASHPLPDELEQNVRAVQASLRDMDAGETGRPIDEFAAEFRQRNGI
jgi:hypothetical protein